MERGQEMQGKPSLGPQDRGWQGNGRDSLLQGSIVDDGLDGINYLKAGPWDDGEPSLYPSPSLLHSIFQSSVRMAIQKSGTKSEALDLPHAPSDGNS